MELKRTLTVELDRVRIITKKSRKHLLFCGLCKQENGFVGVSEALELADIFGSERRKHFHFHQPIGEEIFVCLNSVFESSNPN